MAPSYTGRDGTHDEASHLKVAWSALPFSTIASAHDRSGGMGEVYLARTFVLGVRRVKFAGGAKADLTAGHGSSRSACRLLAAFAEHRGHLRHRGGSRLRLHREEYVEGSCCRPRRQGPLPIRDVVEIGLRCRKRWTRRTARQSSIATSRAPTDAHGARPRQGPRLRAREGPGRTARATRDDEGADDDSRHGGGHGVVHGAGTGAGARHRSPRGSLFARHRAVRAGYGTNAVRRIDANRDHRSDPARHPAPPVARGRFDPAVVRPRRRALAGEVSELPLSIGARDAGGPEGGSRSSWTSRFVRTSSMRSAVTPPRVAPVESSWPS